MASVSFLRDTAPLPCGPSHAIRLLIIACSACLMPLILWVVPPELGVPQLGVMGTMLPLVLIEFIVMRAPSCSQIQARFDTVYYADLLLLTLVLCALMPGLAALLLIVLMHKTLSAILPQPVHARIPLLARIAFGTHVALANLLQLLLAWPTVAPRPRWLLIPPTDSYPVEFVPCCLVPRAPPIQ